MDKGYLQVYTGDGKGKTTAAIGLAIRALGAGKSVFFLQLMKSEAYSEHQILAHISPDLTLVVTGKPFFIAKEGMLTEEQREAWGNDVVIFSEEKPPEDYVNLMKDAAQKATEAAMSGKYDLVVLDEVNVALFFGLISKEDVNRLIENRPSGIELVFTGRNAPEWLLDRADLVTEMKEIKHYYHRGVEARKGIEN